MVSQESEHLKNRKRWSFGSPDGNPINVISLIHSNTGEENLFVIDTENVGNIIISQLLNGRLNELNPIDKNGQPIEIKGGKEAIKYLIDQGYTSGDIQKGGNDK